jgi:hypothetical protein
VKLWLKRSTFALVVFLAGYYGWYCGKTNANHWWKEQPPLRHALIVRSQPSGKIAEPCSVVVDKNSVVTILPNGTFSLNETWAQVRNCQFQWVEVRGQ